MHIKHLQETKGSVDTILKEYEIQRDHGSPQQQDQL